MPSSARHTVRRGLSAPFLARRASAVLLGSVLLATASTAAVTAREVGTVEPVPVPVRAEDLTASVEREHTFTLRIRASHVVLHWPGKPHAVVDVAFSRDGVRFGAPQRVLLDELAGHAEDAAAHGPTHRGTAGDATGHDETETYSSVMVARGAREVRVTSDRPLGQVSLVAMDSRDRRAAVGRPGIPTIQSPRASEDAAAPSAASSISHPPVISRAAWGADESLRLDGFGRDVNKIEFHPAQKLIVHHTAGSNGDPDPPATVRAIYYSHTIVQGWGDIGYNFLIDEAGTIYEGRYSRPYAAGETPTGEDVQGRATQGIHAAGHNPGTIGISLLGTFTETDVTPAARASLETLLAVKADRHDIDPRGAEVYVHPALGPDDTFANIAGHRDVNATLCPGGVFYRTLPAVRRSVSSIIGSTFWQAASPGQVDLPPVGGTASFTISLRRVDGFSDPVDFQVLGLPSDWTASVDPDPADGDSATLSVDVPAQAADGTYPFQVNGTAGSTVRTSRLVLVKGTDIVAPVARIPRVSVQLGSKLGTGDVPVTMRWSATDDQGPITEYTLRESRDAGPWSGAGSQVSTFTVGTLVRGHLYRFQVRASDASGNTSEWATGPSFKVRRYQETNPRVRYSGTWTGQTIGNASGGSVRHTSTGGSTAKLRFSGRAVAWVSSKSPSHGRAGISIDGTNVATVDLGLGPTGPRRVAFIRSWSSPGPHKMVVRALGGRIEVDAFVVFE